MRHPSDYLIPALLALAFVAIPRPAPAQNVTAAAFTARPTPPKRDPADPLEWEYQARSATLGLRGALDYREQLRQRAQLAGKACTRSSGEQVDFTWLGRVDAAGMIRASWVSTDTAFAHCVDRTLHRVGLATPPRWPGRIGYPVAFNWRTK